MPVRQDDAGAHEAIEQGAGWKFGLLLKALTGGLEGGVLVCHVAHLCGGASGCVIPPSGENTTALQTTQACS